MSAGSSLQCDVVSDWAKKPIRRRRKTIKNQEEANGKHLVLFFPRHDVNSATGQAELQI